MSFKDFLQEATANPEKAMDDAKKVIKVNGLKPNKDVMYPGSSAKAKTSGTEVELNF